MLKAYAENKDLYCVIGTGMFNNNYEDNLEFYPEGTKIMVDGKEVICGNKTHIYEDGKLRRKAAKTMLLAIMYGMGAGTAGARMNKTKEEGQALMDNFNAKFTGVDALIKTSKENLKNTGYVEDWAGRRRHLDDFFLPDYEVKYKDEAKVEEKTFNPIFGCKDAELSGEDLNAVLTLAQNAKGNDQFNIIAKHAIMGKYVKNATDIALIKSGKKKESDVQFNTCEPIILSANTARKAQAERQTLNARIQGGAASLTKMAMINIANDKDLNEMDTKLIISVHDEVLVECPAYYADKVEKRLPQIMIDTAKPYITTVPMKCDPYNVERWYCDTAAAEILHEFEQLQKDKIDKATGEIKTHGLPKDIAIDRICEMHPELTAGCIKHTLETGEDLDFSL